MPRGRPPIHVGCQFEGCPAKHYALGWCRKHYKRWYRLGSMDLTGQPKGPDHHWWGGDTPTYGTMHRRILARRGRARDYVCSCGAPAAHWAYNHACPNEVRGPHRPGGPVVPYSLDVDQYDPRCIPCHRRFDLERATSLGARY